MRAGGAQGSRCRHRRRGRALCARCSPRSGVRHTHARRCVGRCAVALDQRVVRELLGALASVGMPAALERVHGLPRSAAAPVRQSAPCRRRTRPRCNSRVRRRRWRSLVRRPWAFRRPRHCVCRSNCSTIPRPCRLGRTVRLRSMTSLRPHSIRRRTSSGSCGCRALPTPTRPARSRGSFAIVGLWRWQAFGSQWDAGCAVLYRLSRWGTQPLAAWLW